MPDKSTLCFCYPWTEVDGQRGGKEIASCNPHIPTRNPLVIRRNKIIYWSDGWVGQNKNRMVVPALLNAISSRQSAINSGVIYTIKYFETGHSKMEADGMHGLIERAGRCVEMGTLESYYTLFPTANVSPSRLRWRSWSSQISKISEIFQREQSEIPAWSRYQGGTWSASERRKKLLCMLAATMNRYVALTHIKMSSQYQSQRIRTFGMSYS